MRWVISATIIAMLFSFAFVPPPVLAAGAGDIESVEEEFDCAVEIESVEEEIESGSVSKAAEADVRAARNMVKKAKASRSYRNVCGVPFPTTRLWIPPGN